MRMRRSLDKVDQVEEEDGGATKVDITRTASDKEGSGVGSK
jgi:hypothetical protein